ncbi:ABC transporter substrate-binding protein [Streptomyces sp. ACA25]|uniref:ABC transporter substrate-binding protein n=1 Tax=Streptomyces sp. ACA25 TaxID=3022596 RepID=UPI002306F314|nr:ABC transporter substrate-binding protein [Streptomyces sp. ACA25]MDB1087491.1 ABC transporter substrate-binding protein [Streptomyces sp. ACA25]
MNGYLPHRRQVLLSALALTGGAALTACGQDGSGSPEKSPAATPAGEPTPGGVLRYGTVAAGGGSAATDPHGILFNQSDWIRLAALYDVLVAPAGKGGVEPRLALSWEAEENATRWRFRLRDDARFTDGSPVRAADVLHSMKRMAEQSMMNGDRLGTVDIEGCAAEDDHTLLVTTSEPDAELPRTLAGVVFVVPEGTEDFDEPVGSGPFRLTALGGQSATLARNDDWWGEPPHLDGLEIRGFADPQALAAAVTSGEIDVASDVAPAAARTADQDDRLGVLSRSAANGYPLLMRLDQAPFDQEKVRQAVKLAVDRQALVDAVFLGYGTPGNDAPCADDPSYPDSLQPPERDLDAARALLAEAGHPDGLDVELHTTTAYPAMSTAAALLERQLGEAGLHVTVREHPPETYWSEVYLQEPLCTGVYAGVGFPTWARQTALSSSAYNETGRRDEAFDEAFASAMAEEDEDRRVEQVTALQEEIATEGGLVAWGAGDGLDVHDARVHGLPDGTGYARMLLDRVWLEQ